MFCTKCGKQLNEGEICSCQNKNKDSFSIDVEKIKSKTEKVFKAVNATVQDENEDTYERGKLIVPDCICANEGEVPIKQYNFAKLKSVISLSFAECRLQITNKRILLRATGTSVTGKTVLHQEFKVDEIAGFEIKKGQRFSLIHLLIMLFLSSLFGGIGGGIGAAFAKAKAFSLIIAIIICLLTAVAYVFIEYMQYKNNSQSKFYQIKQAIVSMSIGFVISCLVRNYEVVTIPVAIPLCLIFLYNSIHLVFAPALTAIIKTKGGGPSNELRRKEINFILVPKREENSGFNQVLPWIDTDLVIQEIGTIIDDLQTIGDAAIEKWQSKA